MSWLIEATLCDSYDYISINWNLISIWHVNFNIIHDTSSLRWKKFIGKVRRKKEI